MKKIICFALVGIFGLLSAGLVEAQTKKLITGNSAGAIKLGMSAARARQAAKPLKVSKGVNVFEGDMLSRVTSGRKLVMTFIEYFGKITSIDVWDKTYYTARGARVGMRLRELEKKYGKLKEIRIDEQEDLEYATFTDQPKGLSFRVAVPGKGKRAGIYPDPETYSTTRYNSGIYLQMIRVQETY